MADGRHFQNGLFAMSQPEINRSPPNFVCKYEFWFRGLSHEKNLYFTNPRRLTDAILKIVFMLYLSQRHIVRLTQNVEGGSRITCRHRWRDQ